MAVLVWAFKPLKQLSGATGFVSIDDEELAAKLLESGDVQDPSIGARGLNAIEPEKPTEVAKPADDYDTRDMGAKPRGRRK